MDRATPGLEHVGDTEHEARSLETKPVIRSVLAERVESITNRANRRTCIGDGIESRRPQKHLASDRDRPGNLAHA